MTTTNHPGGLGPDAVIDPMALALPASELDPSQVVAGDPRTAALALASGDDLSIGVWEITPGVVTDVESDEIFVVLSGRAVVEFDDQDGILQLRPGVVGRLAAGSRTRWTVTETLRKVYITTSSLGADS